VHGLRRAANRATIVPMRSKLWILSSFISVGLLGACGSGSDAPKCVPGASAECACPTGQHGAQSCTSAGTFAACVCAGSPLDSGSGGNGAGGSPPDAAGQGGSGGLAGGSADVGVERGALDGQFDVPMGGTDAVDVVGGTLATGGVTGTGGIAGTGGNTGQGGTTGRDAATSTGGTPSTGGNASTGGSTSTGGKVGTGGMGRGGTGGGSGGGAGIDGGETTGTGGTAGTTGSVPFEPFCAGLTTAAGAAPTKNGICADTDPQLCYKTCGPESIGFKSETCSAGVYNEQSGCTVCTVATCTLCNVSGGYLDSSGAAKSGYCVCPAPSATTGISKWSCAISTAWPCPAGQGC